MAGLSCLMENDNDVVTWIPIKSVIDYTIFHWLRMPFAWNPANMKKTKPIKWFLQKYGYIHRPVLLNQNTNKKGKNCNQPKGILLWFKLIWWIKLNPFVLHMRWACSFSLSLSFCLTTRSLSLLSFEVIVFNSNKKLKYVDYRYTGQMTCEKLRTNIFDSICQQNFKKVLRRRLCQKKKKSI